MMPLAKRFVNALVNSDEFTVREIFVSLGTPKDNGFIISFNDGSQAWNQWIRVKDNMNTITSVRPTAGDLWEGVRE
jgi:hypothetical protein